jgi:hypothetical protein
MAYAAAGHSMSRQSLHITSYLLNVLLAPAALGAAAFSAPQCNLTAGYSNSYLQLLARGQQLGTELMALPSRYIMISSLTPEAIPTVDLDGYFGNLAGWVTAPDMQQHLLLAISAALAMLALHAAYSIGAASSSKQHDVGFAAMKAQHKQQLQQLCTRHAEQLQQLQQLVHLPGLDEEGAQAKQKAAAAKREAAPAKEAAAEARPYCEAVSSCGETAAIVSLKMAFTDQRLLAASGCQAGSMNIVELRQVKKRNACLKGIPTQSNQHVKLTQEAVHAALQIRLEQWLEEQLLLAV